MSRYHSEADRDCLRALAHKLGLELPAFLDPQATFELIASEIRRRGWPRDWEHNALGHGTRACYMRGCRLAECVEANHRYKRKWRTGAPDTSSRATMRALPARGSERSSSDDSPRMAASVRSLPLNMRVVPGGAR